jgi:hypothetical protein
MKCEKQCERKAVLRTCAAADYRDFRLYGKAAQYGSNHLPVALNIVTAFITTLEIKNG